MSDHVDEHVKVRWIIMHSTLMTYAEHRLCTVEVQRVHAVRERQRAEQQEGSGQPARDRGHVVLQQAARHESGDFIHFEPTEDRVQVGRVRVHQGGVSVVVAQDEAVVAATEAV